MNTTTNQTPPRAPLLPDGVAESWFHISCGGEVWTSRVCRGRDLLTVLEEIAGDSPNYAECLADQDFWHVVDGCCVSCALACGEDPDIEVALIDDPSFAMPRACNGNTWHVLSSISRGKELVEMLAATSDDGIGVIARWVRRPDGGWRVTAMDTENGDMQPVTNFHEGECVPPAPPVEGQPK